MKEKFTPKFHDIVYGIIPENTDDLFIDMKWLEGYRTSKKYWDRHCYHGIVLGLGKNVFVFDVESCDFFVIERNSPKRKWWKFWVKED